MWRAASTQFAAMTASWGPRLAAGDRDGNFAASRAVQTAQPTSSRRDAEPALELRRAAAGRGDRTTPAGRTGPCWQVRPLMIIPRCARISDGRRALLGD